jgi:hypothetical protein
VKKNQFLKGGGGAANGVINRDEINFYNSPHELKMISVQ